MRKLLIAVIFTIAIISAHAQCAIDMDTLLKTAASDRVMIYNMQHKFSLLTESNITPTIMP